MQDYIRDNPDDAQVVQNAVDEEMKDQGGSNCGNDLMALRDASAALDRGDKTEAEEAIQKAVGIHDQDQREYAEIGVPYRETSFDEELAKVRLRLAAGEQPTK